MWLHHVSFYIFISLFSISLTNTIRLLIPVKVAYLQEPKLYYEEYRIGYEEENRERNEVDALIKASYINELEEAVKVNNEIFKRKELFYYSAFTFAILASVPYLLCLGFQIAIKDDKVQKVKIVNKSSTFNETSHMAKDYKKTRQSNSTTTKLPGVDNSQVRPSRAQLIKENFQIDSSKAKTAKR